MRMLRALLTILFVSVSVLSFAQDAGYIYKPLAPEGCSVTYSVSKRDADFYIVVTVKSDRLTFLKEPDMLIKTFKGDILKLHGTSLTQSTESSGMIIGNMVAPISDISATAQFKITSKQFELLKEGVAKLRLQTIPLEHERTFKKDKFGKALYKAFIKKQNDIF